MPTQLSMWDDPAGEAGAAAAAPGPTVPEPGTATPPAIHRIFQDAPRGLPVLALLDERGVRHVYVYLTAGTFCDVKVLANRETWTFPGGDDDPWCEACIERIAFLQGNADRNRASQEAKLTAAH